MKLFLDDYRNPIDCFPHMYERVGKSCLLYVECKWMVARSYPQFVRLVNKFKGEITHISFDHDLSDKHYQDSWQEGTIDYHSDNFKNDAEKTGYHAAIYLIELYGQHKIELPQILVHSLNEVGTKNIEGLFNALKTID